MLTHLGWPSGLFGILECAPLKVSGSIPMVPISADKSIQNFDLALNRDPTTGQYDWSYRISQSLYQIPSFQNKNKISNIC